MKEIETDAQYISREKYILANEIEYITCQNQLLAQNLLSLTQNVLSNFFFPFHCLCWFNSLILFIHLENWKLRSGA